MVSLEIVPSHAIASMIMKMVDGIMDLLGLEHFRKLEEILYTVVVVTVALAIGWALRRVIVFVVRKFIAIKHTAAGDELLEQHTVTKCSHIIPPLILMGLIPFAFETDPGTYRFIMHVLVVYTLCAFAIGVNAIITFIWTRFDKQRNTENHPLRGIMNVAHGLVWIVIVIIGVSILVDKSPMALLGGLGAFAAALMLIFKDSILGFVAGIQLSNNDMLRVGDWIVVPSTPANGTVEDVTLTVVKVRNWDNTLIMLPPYTLVSTSFQNWRGMKDSGARRISRSVLIDNATIVPPTAELIGRIEEKFPAMKEYIDSRRQMLADGKGNEYNPGRGTVNGSIETNLGLFRAYICQYLIAHPKIAKDQDMIIRTLEANENGTPLQIYCFTTDFAWIAYEAVQSEMFEHIAAVAPVFGLTIFNTSDGDSIEVDLYDKTPREGGGSVG